MGNLMKNSSTVFSLADLEKKENLKVMHLINTIADHVGKGASIGFVPAMLIRTRKVVLLPWQKTRLRNLAIKGMVRMVESGQAHDVLDYAGLIRAIKQS